MYFKDKLLIWQHCKVHFLKCAKKKNHESVLSFNTIK